jgi:hypothetical protein
MRADRWSRITGRGDRPRHKAEAALRPLAIDRAPPWGLQAMARRHRPPVYLNLGHINHSARIFRPLRQSGARVVVLIHDLIPATHPDLVPPKQPARFAERIAQVRACASLVVAVSGDTERALRAHWPDGPTPAHRPGGDRGRRSGRVGSRQAGARSVPDGRNLGTEEEPRRRSGRMGTPGRRHSAIGIPEAGHIGSAGLVRGGDRRENPRPSGIWHDRSSSTPPRPTTRSASPIPRPIRFSIHRWRRGSAFRRTRHWIAWPVADLRGYSVT